MISFPIRVIRRATPGRLYGRGHAGLFLSLRQSVMGKRWSREALRHDVLEIDLNFSLLIFSPLLSPIFFTICCPICVTIKNSFTLQSDNLLADFIFVTGVKVILTLVPMI